MVVCKLVDIVCNCVYVHIVRTMWKKIELCPGEAQTAQRSYNEKLNEMDGQRQKATEVMKAKKKHNVFFTLFVPVAVFFPRILLQCLYAYYVSGLFYFVISNNELQVGGKFTWWKSKREINK